MEPPAVEIQATPVRDLPRITQDTPLPVEKGLMNKFGRKVLIEEINACLEKHEGDRAKVAEELGFQKIRIHSAINQNKILKARWAKWTAQSPQVKKLHQAPAPTETIDRKPIVPFSSAAGPPTSLSDIESMRRQDEQIAKGLTLLGCKPQEMELAKALQNFHGSRFKQVLDVATAGLGMTLIRLPAMIERLRDKLENGNLFENLGKEGNETKELKLLLDSYRHLVEVQLDAAKTCTEMNFTAAKIDAIKRASVPVQGQRERAAWQPKAAAMTVVANNAVIQQNK